MVVQAPPPTIALAQRHDPLTRVPRRNGTCGERTAHHFQTPNQTADDAQARSTSQFPPTQIAHALSYVRLPEHSLDLEDRLLCAGTVNVATHKLGVVPLRLCSDYYRCDSSW
jgi:hypothetical protein